MALPHSLDKDTLAAMSQLIAAGRLDDFLRLVGIDPGFAGGSPQIKLPRALRKRRAYACGSTCSA
jgi:hypothetical protein